MIKFDSFTLKLLTEEIREFFIGARLRKIQQPSAHELLFQIRNNGENRKFYINFHPDFHHICFMSDENEQKRRLTIPKFAPMFCMLLRKYIMNAKIEDVKVPLYERIFEIYFEYGNELNEKIKLCLAIELMGKHSNVILYNYDTNVIIGCAHNVGSEKSRERELRGLLPYIYPPKQRKKNILKVSKEAFDYDETNPVHSLVERYYYLTVPFVKDVLKVTKKQSKDEIYDILTEFFKKKTHIPAISNDFSQYSFVLNENVKTYDTVNDMIDDYFTYHTEETAKKNLKSKTLNIINNKLNGLYALKSKQEEQIAKETKASEYKTKGDLIMTCAHNIKRGDKSADVYDYEGNPIRIALDENKTAAQNATTYYKLYRKTKTTFEYASERIKETTSRILYFEEQKYFVENSEDIEELIEISDEISGNKSEKTETKQNAGYLEYKGFRIYYGKNKKENDALLSKISSGEDLWFHPLNAAGSHVILKTNNTKEEIPSDVILKAAQLTKEYSAQKNNSKTRIIYTKRKYVKKANNKQAFVTYKNETEIVV